MKKLAVLVSTMLILSVPLTVLADASEPNEVVETVELGKTKVLYSGPIGGDEYLLKPDNFESSIISPMIVISDGPFSWTKDDTFYGSDKIVKDGYSWMATILLGGAAALSSFWVSTLFISSEASAVASGMAGSVFGKATAGLTSTTYTYWTVHKYVDKDSYTLYDKYVVYMYTDPAKTQLKSSFSEVHSNRYR